MLLFLASLLLHTILMHNSNLPDSTATRCYTLRMSVQLAKRLLIGRKLVSNSVVGLTNNDNEDAQLASVD